MGIFGILLGWAAIIGGHWLEGGQPHTLFNAAALVIVLGGTLGATLLQTPTATLLHTLQLLRHLWRPQIPSLQAEMERIISWSRQARVEGLLSLESTAESETDAYTRRGLQLLIDGNESAVIRACMEIELVNREQQDFNATDVFDSMAGYAPTIGIMGAVMGLIQVMLHLDEPTRLGSGIAVAFTATLYGVAFANLLFLPLANKLKAHTEAHITARELVMTGIVAIAEGEHPHHINTRLSGYLI